MAEGDGWTYGSPSNDQSHVQMVSEGGEAELKWFKVRAASLMTSDGFLAAEALRTIYDEWEALVAQRWMRSHHSFASSASAQEKRHCGVVCVCMCVCGGGCGICSVCSV